MRFDQFSEAFNAAVDQAFQALRTRRDSELPAIVGASPLGRDSIIAGCIANAAHAKQQAWKAAQDGA